MSDNADKPSPFDGLYRGTRDLDKVDRWDAPSTPGDLLADFEAGLAKYKADYERGPAPCSHLCAPGPAGERVQCISCGFEGIRAPAPTPETR